MSYSFFSIAAAGEGGGSSGGCWITGREGRLGGKGNGGGGGDGRHVSGFVSILASRGKHASWPLRSVWRKFSRRRLPSGALLKPSPASSSMVNLGLHRTDATNPPTIIPMLDDSFLSWRKRYASNTNFIPFNHLQLTKHIPMCLLPICKYLWKSVMLEYLLVIDFLIGHATASRFICAY